MSAPVPVFRYHPDPIATGAIEPGDEPCAVCGEARGYLYRGPAFAEDELGPICPWCISSGVPGMDFTDVGGAPDGVPEAVLDELARRTPGFSGWQQEHWMYHCDDAAAYLGSHGSDPLEHRFRCLHCSAELSYTDRS